MGASEAARSLATWGDATTPASRQIDSLNKDAFAMCTANKLCWVTEWGFSTHDQSCPLNDQARLQLIQTERSAFETFVKQGRLAAIMFYSWSGMPWTKESQDGIFRCGALTDAGKLALPPVH
jgi:hypothetical protein